MSPRWLCFFTAPPSRAQASGWQLAPRAINGQFHRKHSMQIDGKSMLSEIEQVDIATVAWR
jgi:hypothetical protein